MADQVATVAKERLDGHMDTLSADEMRRSRRHCGSSSACERFWQGGSQPPDVRHGDVRLIYCWVRHRGQRRGGDVSGRHSDSLALGDFSTWANGINSVLPPGAWIAIPIVPLLCAFRPLINQNS